MAPQRRTARPRRLTVAVAAITASVALATGTGLAAGAAGDPVPTPDTGTAQPGPTAMELAPSDAGSPTPDTVPPSPGESATGAGTADPASPTPGASPSASPDPEALPAIGAFLDSGASGVARISELSHWLGGTELKVGHTYLPGGRWQDIESAPGFLDVWARWRHQKADRTFVLNVPMQERNEDHVPDAEVRRLLARGAAGEFDPHFRALAERLVALDLPDTVIVLGWEMNGTTYTHRCGPDPAAWKTYWNRIVTTMRAVPGQRFRFDFTPSRGRDAVPWTECYPGDDTVDIVGMDSYDQPTGMPFDEQIAEPYGLQAHVDFAKAHGKPISYPEWGLFRNGDDAEYMRRMLAWMDEHEPLYQTLTDYCPHGVWQCRQNPRASEVYRTALYGRTDPSATTPAPEPTGTPAPVPPAPQVPAPVPGETPRCTRPAFGDWVGSWLGDGFCLPFGWFPRKL